jgi:hypothetical protein
MFPKVIAVRYIGGYRLEITFSDGTKGISDWSTKLARAKTGGIFEPLKNPAYFAKVELWEGTIRWPNGADICPEVLYERVTGKAPQEIGSSAPQAMPVVEMIEQLAADEFMAR